MLAAALAMVNSRSAMLAGGLVLVVLGLANWHTGRDKTREYRALLDTPHAPSQPDDIADFRFLNARTNATVLASLDPGDDESAFVASKLQFYELVQVGGRTLALAGLFLGAVSLVLGRLRGDTRPRRVESRPPAV